MASLRRILCAFGLLRLSLQQEPDPIDDFCRRFGHQTAVIDRKLYIDGGLLNWNPIAENPLNYSNPYLLYNDLESAPEGMPQLHAGLSKGSEVPDVSGGVLWADEVNKIFYLYGGEFRDEPDDFALWSYDTILDQWSRVSTDVESIQRVAWGAGVAVNDRAEGYYLGGWLNEHTVPGWTARPTMTSTLIRYDMETNAITNNTGPDDVGRAEGVMVYLPASDGGLLVYFGGVLDPFHNGTAVGADMKDILIYDLASSLWYTQTATGDIPAMRSKFCAGATWADDYSSYNIYLYGGRGMPPHTTGFDDVYILSLPAFVWIKWFPTEPGPGVPHNSLSCNVINNSQMLIIGGTFPLTDECDAQTFWGTHNLNLGEDGPQNSMWDLYYPNITEYHVPPEIIEEIGGSSIGRAKVTEPAQGWDNRDLPVYFTRVPSFAARTPTRPIPTATGTTKPTTTSTNKPTTSSVSAPSDDGSSGSSNTAAIAGGVVAGVVFVAIVVLLLFCLRRRRQTPAQAQAPATPHSELPATSTIAELDAHGRNGRGSKIIPWAGASPTTAANLTAYSPVELETPGPSPYDSAPENRRDLPPSDGSFRAHQTSPAASFPWTTQSPNSQSLQHPRADQPPQSPYPVSPYNPADHSLHHEHFPPPQSPASISSPSAHSNMSRSPTVSATPVHFYPRSPGVAVADRTSGSRTRDSQPVRGRFIEDAT